MTFKEFLKTKKSIDTEGKNYLKNLKDGCSK